MHQLLIILNDGHVILLIGIIAMLVVIVAVLLWCNLRNQQQIRDKNDTIIRSILENVALRDELQRRLAETANSHAYPNNKVKYQPLINSLRTTK